MTVDHIVSFLIVAAVIIFAAYGGARLTSRKPRNDS